MLDFFKLFTFKDAHRCVLKCVLRNSKGTHFNQICFIRCPYSNRTLYLMRRILKIFNETHGLEELAEAITFLSYRFVDSLMHFRSRNQDCFCWIGHWLKDLGTFCNTKRNVHRFTLNIRCLKIMIVESRP